MKTGSMFLILIAFSSLVLFNACSKDNAYTSTTNPPENNPPSDADFSNVTYGSNVDWKGAQQQLNLDVYLPASAVAGTKYPLVLWIHGGGFVGGDKESAGKFSTLIADQGYVVAPINYRLGWTQDQTNTCLGDTTEAKEAFYRSVQDARAALRFLVANADKYSIDTNWIFIGGASAGAISALGTAYYTQDLADKYLTDITSKLGSLNTDNDLTNTYRLRGILSMWGAVSHLEMITQQSALPTIFFQGTSDNVVPFEVGHFYSCDNFQIAYGTKPMYEKLTNLQVPAIAHVEPDGGHGVFSDDFRASNSVCFMNSLMTKTSEKGYYVGDNAYSCP